MTVRDRMLGHRSHRDQLRDSRQQRHALEAEIATFTSARDRSDLEALFVRYDDWATLELRDILVRQQASRQQAADRSWRTVGGL